MGVCCVAAPILIRSREPVAAIGITALVSEMSPASLRAAGRLLTDEAEALTRTLGVAG
jgi:DNA-binding IclR family transcriptional regulator